MPNYPGTFLQQLDDFQLVVVPTAGIKSDIATAYEQWKRATSTCWAAPTFRTWDQHLRNIWKRSRHEFRDYKLLAPHEFRYLWTEAGLSAFREAARARGDAGDEGYDPAWIARYVSAISEEAIGTWRLVNEYSIDLGELKQCVSPEAVLRQMGFQLPAARCHQQLAV